MIILFLGQPQMVKVVQNNSSQSLAHIKFKSNPVKVVKISTNQEGNIQVTRLCVAGILYSLTWS